MESEKGVEVSNVILPEFEEKKLSEDKEVFHKEVRRIIDLKIQIAANLGEKKLTIGEINDLKVGSVIEVDRIPGHLMEIMVGSEPVALGEIIPMENKFGLVISEVLNGKNEVLKKMNRNGEID